MVSGMEQPELSKYVVLLLPSYLEGMISLFTGVGLAIIHTYDPKVLEAEIKEFDPDLAIEWQHGPEDYTVRDLIRKCEKEKEIPILFVCNWNGRLPDNFSELGYQDFITAPWSLDGLMSKFYGVLPEGKIPILRDLWKRAKKRGVE